jgi:hypothetical protein
VIRAGLLVAVLVGTAAAGAAAQADTTARRDTTARDSTKRDTATALLPTLPRAIASGPQPLGARYVFTADSLLFGDVRTLSDLLGRIPGVYVARGGWFGQAEPIVFGGRGPLAVEVYWDGVPYLPVGRDSVYLDPARIPLAPLERVDVLVLPAALRVYLVTSRPRSTQAVTQVGVATGDADIAGYRAGYAARTRGGLGLSLLADWNHLRGSGAGITTFDNTDYWMKAEYVPPGGRLGASFQILSSSWRRAGATGTVDPWRMLRRDEGLRFFAAARSDGLGPRLTGSIGSTLAEKDTAIPRRSFRQATLEASQTWPRASVTLAGRFGFRGAPTDVEARAGWIPVPGLTLAGSRRHATYSGGRSGDRANLTAGVALPLGVSVRGEVAWMRDVQAPFVGSDSVQEATDAAAWVRFDHPRVSFEVGRGRRDPFVPLAFAAGIRPVAQLDSTPRTDFLAAHATLHPLAGFTLSGWYFDPISGGGSFEPPHHARVSATFYSKFWRVFPSGAFALRGEFAVESWSRWTLGGRDSGGAPRALGGATFVETNIEMQLVGVTFFWIRHNLYGMRTGYVAGLGYPRSVQIYGARWFFSN